MNSVNIIKVGLVLLLLSAFASWAMAQQPVGKQQEVIIPGLYQMPETNEELKEKTPGIKSAVQEDLHRFMGYEILPARYLSLPFDVFIKTNYDGTFTDGGFLLLLLIPVLFLWPLGKEDKEQVKSNSFLLNGGVMILLSLFLIISISSAYMNSHKLVTPQQSLQHLTGASDAGITSRLNKSITQTALQLYQPIFNTFSKVSGTQDKITYPFLLLLFVLISFLVGLRFKQHSKIIKTMALFQMTYLFLWWILGSGGAWYGLLLFCIPFVFVLKGIEPKKTLTGFTLGRLRTYALLGIAIIWVVMAVVFRMVNYNPISKEHSLHFYIPPIIEYQTGHIDERKLKGFCFPQHHNVGDIINQNDKALVYLVGTTLSYFIKKNDKRVINDTFLNFFEQLVKRFKNKEKIIQALKVAGFEYLVLDLNLATMDQTPNQTLVRKFTQLLNTLYNNPHVELVSTNRQIKLNGTGQVVNSVFEDQGVIVNRGDIALFRLK